jgi:hypothetical protein
MTHPRRHESGRTSAERRTDILTADIVQIGIYFLEVYGKCNAEAFFMGTDVPPTVYRRVIGGQFRTRKAGGDAEHEHVLA